MQQAIDIAYIFGPFLTIMGIWMLLYGDNLMKVVASLKNSPGCFYILGIINLLIGLTIINMYNEWIWDLSLSVTLLGWFTLLRGILIFFMPQLIVKSTMTKKKAMHYVGIVQLVWGLILSWLAFHT